MLLRPKNENAVMLCVKCALGHKCFGTLICTGLYKRQMQGLSLRMQSEIGSNESCTGYAYAHTRGIALGTRQRRFDLRESRPRLNGASTCVTLIGRIRATVGTTEGEDCGG